MQTAVDQANAYTDLRLASLSFDLTTEEKNPGTYEARAVIDGEALASAPIRASRRWRSASPPASPMPAP